MRLLPDSFYTHPDVTEVAKNLLGKLIKTSIDGQETLSRIVETEAYSERERGCHAYQGKRTPRTEVFFEKGGVSYVYICYGIHRMFNVVTNEAGIADAVLIRAVEPIEGIDMMKERRKVSSGGKVLTGGPGRVAQALGIGMEHNGLKLDRAPIQLFEDDFIYPEKKLKTGPRIGLNFPGPDAILPWRFWLAENKWISR